jgi:DNA-binding MltR family transcriptional regulator
MDFEKFLAGKVNREELIASLLADVDPDSDKAQRIMNALYKEADKGTDRGVAVVGGSFAEEALKALLLAYFNFGASTFGFSRTEKNVSELSESLFNYNRDGALSTFTAKAKLARLLGLISSGTYKNLTIVARIRNDFAHNVEIDSFNHPTILAKVRKLAHKDETQYEPHEEALHHFAHVLGDIFTMVVGVTSGLEKGIPFHMSLLNDQEM